MNVSARSPQKSKRSHNFSPYSTPVATFARGLLLIAPLVVLPGFHMNKKKLIDAVENMSIQAHHSQEEQFSLLLS